MLTDIERIELKFKRASQHLDQLQVESTAWLKGGHYTSVTQPDPTESPYFLIKVTAQDVPLDPFGPLIGDVLHNVRSGLDHLAYALAVSHTKPLPKDIAEDCEFPIFGDVDRKGTTGVGGRLFQQGGVKKIRGIDPRAQAIIQSAQPYHRGKDFKAHPLWRLHELSNIDKHRFLHPVAHHSAGMAITPDLSYNANLGPGKIEVFVTAVEKDTIVMRYPATPIDPKREMYMHIEPALSIAFPQGSIVGGEDVIQTLSEIYNFAVAHLLNPLERFL